jgi:hypothetical protein
VQNGAISSDAIAAAVRVFMERSFSMAIQSAGAFRSTPRACRMRQWVIGFALGVAARRPAFALRWATRIAGRWRGVFTPWGILMLAHVRLRVQEWPANRSAHGKVRGREQRRAHTVPVLFGARQRVLAACMGTQGAKFSNGRRKRLHGLPSENGIFQGAHQG